MLKIKLQIISILLLIITSTSSILPGTTGKIAGTVTDKRTGEPLPGASVIIEGTTLGAATDLSGHYVILQVPPGTYNLQVSFVGYRKTIISDVRVNIDQTAEVNIILDEEAYQLDEMVITAEKKVIKKDVATSVASITDTEIQALPVTGIVSAIGLQAGIRGGWGSFFTGGSQPSFVSNYIRGKVSVQGGLNIRGGDGDAILFMLDGVILRDPRNNEPITKIPLSSVQEVSVERGGFNAEYGQVSSGIVNVITKEGSKQSYTGNIQVRYSPPSPKYWQGPGILDVQDPYSFALRPFFDPDVCWTGTGNGAWNEYTQSQYPEFAGWNEIARVLNTDNDPSNDLTPLGAQRVFEYEIRKKQPNDEPDYDIDAGFGGPIPLIGESLGNLRFYSSYRMTREMLLWPLNRPDYQDYDWSIQVNSDITPTMRLRFLSLFGKQYTIRNNWDSNGNYFYPRSPSDVAGLVSTINAPSDLIGMFSDYNNSLADVEHRVLAGKFIHTIDENTFYEISVEHLRREYDVRPGGLRDTTVKVEVIDGFLVDLHPFGYWPYDVSGVIITGGQHVAKSRDFSVVNSTTFKADFTSQLNFQNLFKAGIEILYNDLNFDYGVVQSGGQADDSYQDRVQMRVYPIRAGAYVQDKVEFMEFTINAGLRLDYNNSNVDWWSIPFYDRNFFSSIYSREKDELVFPTEPSEPQWQLSPRLGIAHPITENSKLFFNYGHYKQVPQYESLFRLQRDYTGAMSSFGNPNITTAKTISYELGFDYLFSDQILLQAAGFYKDISDQQDFTVYQSLSKGFSYTRSTSNNYQDTRGFELTLRKIPGEWWSGFANYTYQVNTSGHFGSSRLYDDRTQQRVWDEATVNLYQDRPIPQPYARLNLDFKTPEELGPELFEHYILGGFGLNIVLDWQAGYWTTWNPGSQPQVAYNVQARDYFNTYLRFDKIINIGVFSLRFFMDINNVLNTKRLWNTGDYEYMSSLHLPKSKDYPNIPGDDKVGDYREPGVEFQPMEFVNQIDPRGGNEGAWYFENTSGKYFEWTNNQWIEVDQNRLNKVLEDKAYIDMPNASTFWFLDPRRIFFGINISFHFN